MIGIICNWAYTKAVKGTSGSSELTRRGFIIHRTLQYLAFVDRKPREKQFLTQ